MASAADHDKNMGLPAQIPISPAATRHRQMYKCSTPPWKDTFRKRCRDRLSSKRDDLLNRYRLGVSSGSGETDSLISENEIKGLISEEWNAMKRDSLVDPDMGRSEDVDKLLSIFEEMSRELLAAEQAMISEYDKQQALEDAEISHLVNSTSSVNSSSRVICPICSQHPLYLDRTILRCSCGLHLDTEQDAVTLDMIGRNLTDGTEHHANNCTHRPQFSVVNQFGIISNLLMTCSVCDYMFVVV